VSHRPLHRSGLGKEPAQQRPTVKGDRHVSVSEEHESIISAVTDGTGHVTEHAAEGAGRRGRWWVVTAATAVLLVLLCVRNRFLFSTRLYEDADMGANYALSAVLMALVAGIGSSWTGSVRGAAACFAAVVAFASVHPAILSTDWMPYLYVPTYIAFLVAAASVAAGRERDAWILALTGWFLIHGAAFFLFLVPLITCVVLVAVMWSRRPVLGPSIRSFFATQRRVW